MPLEERRERDRYWLFDPDFAAALTGLGWPDPEALLEAAPDASRGRAATRVLSLEGRPERLHLRAVRHGGLTGPLWGGALWGFERPARELRTTERLLAAGAPVARPVWVAARRRLGPLWTAVLATRHEEGARDGLAWLGTRPDAEVLRRGAAAVGDALRHFHDAGGWHADLHVKNLLLRETGEAFEVRVIDLDGARDGSPPPPARRMRELMRLVRSLHKRGVAAQVGSRGCATAFGAYCAGDRELRQALLASLPREARRLARHRWAYRTA